MNTRGVGTWDGIKFITTVRISQERHIQEPLVQMRLSWSQINSFVSINKILYLVSPKLYRIKKREKSNQ